MEDDFYQDYNDVEEDSEKDKKKSKKSKKEKKKEKKSQVKTKSEDFSYNDYYESNNDESKDDYSNDDSGSNKVLLIVLGILLVVLAVLLIIKFLPTIKEKFGNDEEVVLPKTQYTLNNGESTLISYTSKYTNLEWKSDNENVCTIEGNRVTAVGLGSCVITISGIDENGSDFSYKVYITVSDNTAPETPSGDLSLDIRSNGSDGWNSSDVSITVNATGYTRLVYVVNCNGTCDYKNVSNGLITVNVEGENKVTVIASKGEREVKKDVTVKIDKSKPTCNLTAANSSLNASVNDTISGINKKGFNKDYSDNSTTKTVNNVGTYTYYVMDNAGNTNTCTINVSGSKQYRTASCIRGKACAAAGCSEFDDTKWTDATDTEGICTGRTSDITSGDVRCTNCSSGTCKFQTTVCKTPKRSIDKCGCDSWSEFGEWTNDEAKASNYLKVETRVIIK